MAKGKKRGRASANSWTGFDHAARSLKKNKGDEGASLSEGQRRTLARTHDSKEKRETKKLKLHIAKTQRDVEKLRHRLQNWDDKEEAERRKEEERQESDEPTRKQGRKGPESWKLRGAARPAAEVYDFDTRYVDPHIKAHDEASSKFKRQRNILVIYKGRMGEDGDDGPPQPQSRNLLALLMQLGLLCLQAQKYKAARAAFLECLALDGTDEPITNARTRLMRLYLEANRPDSARRLWETMPNDTSAWIRFSAALVEYVSWKLLEESGSSRASAEALLAQAIRSNCLCAFYIAFHDVFESVMEYTDEIEDADEGTLEEAIEYCNSEQWGAWTGTEGAVEWVRKVILRSLQGVGGGVLNISDLGWNERLRQYEENHPSAKPDLSGEHVDGSNDGETDDAIDVAMFAGMFRTAMDMLEESGELSKPADDST